MFLFVGRFQNQLLPLEVRGVIDAYLVSRFNQVTD